MGAMHETRGRCSGLRGKRLLQEAVRLKETLSINCELSEKSLLILAKRIRQAAPVMPRRQSGQSTLRPRRNQKMLRGLGFRLIQSEQQDMQKLCEQGMRASQRLSKTQKSI